MHKIWALEINLIGLDVFFDLGFTTFFFFCFFKRDQFIINTFEETNNQKC